MAAGDIIKTLQGRGIEALGQMHVMDAGGVGERDDPTRGNAWRGRKGRRAWEGRKGSDASHSGALTKSLHYVPGHAMSSAHQ